MECLLEAYAGGSSSDPESPSPKVNYYEDVFSEGDGSDFEAKKKSVRDAKFDEALLKFYISDEVKQLKRRLTSIRADKKIRKLIVKALNLEFQGVDVITADDIEDVQGKFSPCSDGRMSIDLDSWAEVVTEKGLSEDQVVMFLFHRYGDIFSYRSGVVISVDVI